jgi:predicted unusual protein kinase regulating ubiquinone biosynthesis (AarF/ABC1/UbiB family)
MHQELDFVQKAQSVIRFKQRFADSQDIVASSIHEALSTRQVLVMERIEGLSFRRIPADDTERFQRVTDRLTEATHQQVSTMGSFTQPPIRETGRCCQTTGSPTSTWA